MLIVFNHTFGDTLCFFLQSFGIFRMPLYFVLSGLFFKTYGGFANFVKKKTNKLLIPLIIVYIFISLPSNILLSWRNAVQFSLVNMLLLPDGTKLNMGISPGSWFLMCLFWVNLYFYIIYIICKGNYILIGVLSILCGCMGYYLGNNGFVLPFWLDTALTALPFFFLGYFLRSYSNFLNEEISYYHLYLFVVSLGLCAFVISMLDENGMILYVGNTYHINLFGLYAGGVFGSLGVLIIAKYFNMLPIVSYMGRYSIVVLLTHQTFLFFIRNILYQVGIHQQEIYWLNTIIFLFVILLSLPTIKYGIKYLPYMFAQKDLWV